MAFLPERDAPFALILPYSSSSITTMLINNDKKAGCGWSEENETNYFMTLMNIIPRRFRKVSE